MFENSDMNENYYIFATKKNLIIWDVNDIFFNVNFLYELK